MSTLEIIAACGATVPLIDVVLVAVFLIGVVAVVLLTIFLVKVVKVEFYGRKCYRSGICHRRLPK